MSAWGNRDNVLITGNVSYTSTSNTVSNAAGNVTFFAANVNAGDYLIIAGKEFQVKNVVSNVSLVLTSNVGATGNGVAYIQQGPKYLSNVITDDIDPSNIVLRVPNLLSIQRVFGIDRDEIANVAGPRSANANAACHVGWVAIYNYNYQGNTRTKAEVLVAMSKNFNANATGNIQAFLDASDDSTLPEVPGAGG